MGEYILSCCSTCDLSQEHCDKRDIKYAYFHFSINGEQFTDDLGQSMPYEEFYKRIVPKGTDVKTSQVNVDEFIEYFTPFLEEGKDILHITISTGLSGVYNSATTAAEDLRKKFPDRKIYIVDSLAASSGYGLMMDKLADLRDEGYDIDKLKDWAEANKLRIAHWVCTTDLSFLIRGGRVSKAAGFVGSVLKICPIINVSEEGKLVPTSKVRSKQKALCEVLNRMKTLADNGLNYSDKCYISHSDCIADAQYLADMIESTFPHLCGKVEINYIGPTIGSHTGPGTVALFFWQGESR